MFKFSSSLVFLAAALFCSGVSAQDGSVLAELVSAESSKCLTVRNRKFANGTPVEMNDCNNSTSQQWEIYPGRYFPGHTEVRIADRFCIDAKSVNSSSTVVIWECNQSPWQQWIFTDSVEGLLTLAKNTDLCLDVPSHSTNNGVQVETYTCNGGDNQVWNLVHHE